MYVCAVMFVCDGRMMYTIGQNEDINAFRLNFNSVKPKSTHTHAHTQAQHCNRPEEMKFAQFYADIRTHMTCLVRPLFLFSFNNFHLNLNWMVEFWCSCWCYYRPLFIFSPFAISTKTHRQNPIIGRSILFNAPHTNCSWALSLFGHFFETLLFIQFTLCIHIAHSIRLVSSVTW